MKKLVLALSVIFAVTTSYITIDKTVNNTEPKYIVEKSTEKKATTLPENEIKTLSAAETLYQKIDFSNINKLNYEVFEKAFTGFNNLKAAGKIDENTKLLTVADFSLSSNTKRLWVIDTESGEILFNSLVAHGKNTGEEFATKFSNIESSYQSSLGFYVTDVTYTGENGYSLRLLGMDAGYNDAALQRAIVMHGADYVSETFAAQHKRIGRSWGCPAVPRALAEPIINTIKGKNVLFIYYPDENYLNTSKWLNA